jgi:hypothetical protein
MSCASSISILLRTWYATRCGTTSCKWPNEHFSLAYREGWLLTGSDRLVRLDGELIDANNSVADRVHNNFTHRMQLQFVHKVGSMSLCRFHAAA